MRRKCRNTPPRGGLALGVCASFLGVAHAVNAQTPPLAADAAPFGGRGQFVITGASTMGISFVAYSASQASSFGAVFSPGLDYFISRNISVGVDVDVSYGDAKGYGADGSLIETTTTTVAAGPRVAFTLPFGRSPFSLYPRLTLGFEWTQRDEQLVSGASLSVAGSALGYPSSTQVGPTINLFIPLLFHPTGHFFMGFGPSVFHEFGHVSGGPDVGGQRTTIACGLVVGGYFGGERAPADALEDGPRPVPPRRFGMEGEWVLTNDLTAGISSTGYIGTSSSALGATLDVGFDYFVADNVSMGAAAAISYNRIQGTDASSGAPVTTSVTGGGVLARLGYSVPVARWLSWFPRVSLGFSTDTFKESSGVSANQPSENIVTIAAFAPILVHPVPHFFAGLGPYVSQDVSRSVSFPNSLIQVQNQSSRAGLTLVVGGW